MGIDAAPENESTPTFEASNTGKLIRGTLSTAAFEASTKLTVTVMAIESTLKLLASLTDTVPAPDIDALSTVKLLASPMVKVIEAEKESTVRLLASVIGI
jgi:hypothetical protein